MDANEKILGDLDTVLEQVRLCREMLPESSGIASDDLLREVVGFLEACQGRLLELLEAGFQGLLSEAALEQCLRVNDALTRTLEAEKVRQGRQAGRGRRAQLRGSVAVQSLTCFRVSICMSPLSL